MSNASPEPLSRATDVAGIRERMSRFQSTRGAEVCAQFVPRADDVLIATYPKCGTTWMQQIVHSLRTRGDMDFEEITEVVPWIEMAHDVGQDLDADQRGTPRAFKTHLDGDAVPGGARYIYIIRDPRDVLVSFFRFFEGWVFEAGSIDLNTFAREFFLPGSMRSGNYWQHLASWWPRHDAADTLMFSYEEMNADPRSAIVAVARFIGIDDDATIAIACERASFETMRAQAHRFDDNLVRRYRSAICGLPNNGATGKVRSGRVGGHRALLADDVLSACNEMWQEYVATPLGLVDYAAVQAQIRRAREAQHG